MHFDVSGLDKLEKRLKEMERAAKKLHGTHNVPFSELFTTGFMRKYTHYNSFDELLDGGGFVVNNSDDFDAIPDDVFDKHISANTRFNTWQDMMEKAATEYALRKLGF